MGGEARSAGQRGPRSRGPPGPEGSSELVALWPLPGPGPARLPYPAPPPIPGLKKQAPGARDRNVVTSCVGAGLMTKLRQRPRHVTPPEQSGAVRHFRPWRRPGDNSGAEARSRQVSGPAWLGGRDCPRST